MAEEHDVIVVGTVPQGVHHPQRPPLRRRPEALEGFRGEDKPLAHLGASRDYNVDIVPKVRKIGKVAHAIAIMSHPIPNTNYSHSVQIFFHKATWAQVKHSYDATTHFETNVTDVLDMYKLITGKTVDMSAASAAEEY
ncbi:hypothetical protein ABZP36_030946 [Zizania latifolia]